MRFAGVSTLAVASALSCGSSDLQPIHVLGEPGPDAGLAIISESGGQSDAGMLPREAGAPAARACKRGVAANAAPSAAFARTSTSPGVSWWYNWANQPPAGGNESIEFVPMIWGPGSLDQTIPSGSKGLLGFNEDRKST